MARISPDPAAMTRDQPVLALSDSDVRLVRDSFEHVSMDLVPLAADFYEILFRKNAELRALFADDLGPQVAKLAHTLSFAVAQLEQRETLHRDLVTLGALHQEKGVETAHYDAVADALVAALARSLGAGWEPRIELAWRKLLKAVGASMLLGAQEAGPG